MDLPKIERYLHREIPITRAMGVRVESRDGEKLVLTAPLAPNHNHLGTAFGGSLNALAMLAGYALIWLEVNDRECHVLVRDATINFRRPVTGTIRALCRRPEETRIGLFREEFGRRGRAKLGLEVVIEENGETAVEFSGIYVARKQTPHFALPELPNP